MPRFLRFLRIAFSVSCGIACVLLIVLWVRSYSTQLRYQGPWRAMVFHFVSQEGRFSARTWKYAGKRKATRLLTSLPVDEERKHMMREDLGFDLGDITIPTIRGTSIVSPFWVPVAITASCAALPWLRWRFSLRTLLIATTLVAVVLGLIVWSMK